MHCPSWGSSALQVSLAGAGCPEADAGASRCHPPPAPPAPAEGPRYVQGQCFGQQMRKSHV